MVIVLNVAINRIAVIEFQINEKHHNHQAVKHKLNKALKIWYVYLYIPHVPCLYGYVGIITILSNIEQT